MDFKEIMLRRKREREIAGIDDKTAMKDYKAEKAREDAERSARLFERVKQHQKKQSQIRDVRNAELQKQIDQVNNREYHASLERAEAKKKKQEEDRKAAKDMAMLERAKSIFRDYTKHHIDHLIQENKNALMKWRAEEAKSLANSGFSKSGWKADKLDAELTSRKNRLPTLHTLNYMYDLPTERSELLRKLKHFFNMLERQSNKEIDLTYPSQKLYKEEVKDVYWGWLAYEPL